MYGPKASASTPTTGKMGETKPSAGTALGPNGPRADSAGEATPRRTAATPREMTGSSPNSIGHWPVVISPKSPASVGSAGASSLPSLGAGAGRASPGGGTE